MELDHVLLAVDDLSAAAAELDTRHGLASVEGGRHPDFGTENRIVPLGSAYLELVAVRDPGIAAGTSFGRWVAATAAKPYRLLGYCVRTRDLGEVSRRLELSVGAGSRITPTGEVLRWRLAGLEHAVAEPALPFFIEWGGDTGFPGAQPVEHRAERPAISEVVLSGDEARLAEWLGNGALPISMRSGPPAVVAVVVVAGGREIVLGAEAARA